MIFARSTLALTCPPVPGHPPHSPPGPPAPDDKDASQRIAIPGASSDCDDAEKIPAVAGLFYSFSHGLTRPCVRFSRFSPPRVSCVAEKRQADSPQDAQARWMRLRTWVDVSRTKGCARGTITAEVFRCRLWYWRHCACCAWVANLPRADAEDFRRIAPAVPVYTDVTPSPLAAANQALDDLRHGCVTGAAVIQLTTPT
jgi:hypothetical protein